MRGKGGCSEWVISTGHSTGTMYRTIIILLCSIAVSAAPQDTVNSEITYVKIQPVTDNSTPTKTPYRESRIENLPLTIPGNAKTPQVKNTIKQNSRRDEVSSSSSSNNDRQIPSDDEKVDNQERIKSETNKTDRNDDKVLKNNYIKLTNDKLDNSQRPKSETTKRDSHFEVPITNDSTHSNHNGNERIRSKTTKRENQELTNDSPIEITNEDQADSSRKIRSEDTTATYDADTTEPTEAFTETVQDSQTEDYETRTKAPRFISKLSYFQKDEVKSFIATNLVEATGRRRFKSKCRCEKIWNCPKLQITVPRCPNEYFLCCF